MSAGNEELSGNEWDWLAEIKRGVSDCIPVLLGIIPYALVLGAQATQKGLSAAEVPLMTGLNFAGGSEFAAIHLWTSPPHIALIVAVTFLVNSRHLLMGAALAPFLRHLPKRKVLPMLFVMTDESWALALADTRKRANAGKPVAFSAPYYLGISMVFYLAWVGFTTLGGVIAPLLGNIHSYGFDMAFPAVFLVLMAGMWKGVRQSLPWLASFLAAASVYLLVPGAWYVVVGATSGLTVAYLMGD